MSDYQRGWTSEVTKLREQLDKYQKDIERYKKAIAWALPQMAVADQFIVMQIIRKNEIPTQEQIDACCDPESLK